MAHESRDRNLGITGIRGIDECSTTINVIAPQPVYKSFDRFESAFVQDKVPRENMHCMPVEMLSVW
jgi:hypothetical protein